MPFAQFNRDKLRLLPLSERIHDIDLSVMLDPHAKPSITHPDIPLIADRIRSARDAGSSVLMMMGGHVIRSGAAPVIMELMRRGYITHAALNGAAAIHDFELAMIGASCESVAKYISEGQFGLWYEDSAFNDAVNLGDKEGLGLGESLGRYIEEQRFPHREFSLLAFGYREQKPVTVHVGIGNDIVHEHPNMDGAATGRASYTDFLIYTETVTNLEHGVFLNFGSAVTGPEVYLKALSMARNAAHAEGKSISKFTTAVFDIQPFGRGDHTLEPDKSDPRYYFRPWKTILVRTVADGGESFYVEGLHKDTVAALAWQLTGGNRFE